MKNRNGNGNATGVSFSTAVIDENPYIQRLQMSRKCERMLRTKSLIAPSRMRKVWR